MHDGQRIQSSGGLVSAILALTQAQTTDGVKRFDNEILWVGRAENTPEELTGFRNNRDHSG